MAAAVCSGRLVRALTDVGLDNVGVGLDTANVILYGKANPVDAAEILGKHIKAVHAKDGLWPTNPRKLGEEVAIGQGKVDFKRVFQIMHHNGYTGAITIEREISGPKQVEDVKRGIEHLNKAIATLGV